MMETTKKKTCLINNDQQVLANMAQHQLIGNILNRYDAVIGKSWQYFLPEKKKVLQELRGVLTGMQDVLTPTEKQVLGLKVRRLYNEVASGEADRLAKVAEINGISL